MDFELISTEDLYEDDDVVEKITQDERIRRLTDKIESVLSRREQDIIRKRYG